MTMTSYFCKIYISLVLLAAAFSSPSPAHAQFVDNFDGPTVALDPEGNHGWLFLAGDGTATMDLRQGGPGYASVFVDATTDKRGIWWALIERKLNGKLDLSLLKNTQLRSTHRSTCEVQSCASAHQSPGGHSANNG